MIRVLLFRPNAAVAGGVVNYYSIVLNKLSDDVRIEEFLVGRRAGLLGSAGLYPIQFILDCLSLVFLLCTRKHDIYHFNPSLNRPSYVRDWVFVFILRVFRKERIIVFFRGWEQAYFENLVSNRWKRKLFLWFLSRASRIIVLASIFQEDLKKLGVAPEKIEITSTTFDGSMLAAVDVKKNNDVVTFLFMSRLIENKGIFELVEAARILKAEGQDFRLKIAGSGPCEGAIRDRVHDSEMADKVHLTGYLRNKEKAQAIVSSDIFILPTSHGEGCPNCILEAMGAGLPVISTRVGGIPDIVKEPQNGILLADVAPEKIARAMREYMDDTKLRTAVSEHNREQSWRLYESNKVAMYLESVYTEVAAQRSIEKRP
ncbi:MAG: glycosyltransferase family 4 protein [Halioglobus sp.]|nr:glycosyltransferase family 4 protein [Halioglobus sp.]